VLGYPETTQNVDIYAVELPLLEAFREVYEKLGKIEAV
jgi:hypothetical protein